MTVQVVNTIPRTLSSETERDAEPNVAVNPANPLEMALSAFTPDPLKSGSAPIFVSTDGGNTWDLNVVLPGGDTTRDTTLRFGTSSNVLYAGILRFDTQHLNLLRKSGFTSPGLMTTLVDRVNEDQPYIEAATVVGGAGASLDRVYVGHNDFNVTNKRTATIEASLDAATAPAPAGFAPDRLDVRATSGQDGPSIRPTIHSDGTVYAAFFGWRSVGTGGVITSDVVVVRDDNWAAGPNPFTSLKDASDGKAGQRVATVTLPPDKSLLGSQRVLFSQLAIAIDSRNSEIVYLAWADGAAGANYTIHLRRSTDKGQTWSSDLRTIGPATNPALAINVRGKVALLYQWLDTSKTPNRWETHVELSDNGFSTTPTDLTLANVPDLKGSYTGSNPLGDYVGLVSVGKDFFGAFSAYNEPILSNFPQGVTYQRNVNWGTGTLLANDGVTQVAASIDPFFFKIGELDASDDFYVRDWTDSPTSGDQGSEPSTHQAFYVSSDVWNRRGTLPGGFSNDQPENEDAGNGAGGVGDNWAFARIRRNAPSTAAAIVSAHFLVSKFGTGSNYVDAGSADPDVSFPDPDPTVTFNPGDVGPFVTPPCHWHLNAVSSTHLCLAVEISAPGDPFVPPSLVGNAPGWPSSDLRVINDNNKAQRNMALSATPARGVGAEDDFYAIIHNPATTRRNIKLRLAVDPNVFKRLKGPRVSVVGGQEAALKPGMTITLPRMQPGENRWLRLTFTAPSGREGEIVPVHVLELVNETILNGFAVGVRLASTKAATGDVVRKHRNLLVRLTSGFGMAPVGQNVAAASELLAGDGSRGSAYLRLVRAHVKALDRSVKQLLAQHARLGDPFSVRTALRKLDRCAQSRATNDVIVTHSALLNALDSYLTMLQLGDGDSADVLQNVRWQQRLYTTVPALARLRNTPVLLDWSDRFIRGYGERRVTNRDYSALVSSLMESYEETVRSSGTRHLRLGRHVAHIKRGLGNVSALQKAHRGFLSKLQRAVRS